MDDWEDCDGSLVEDVWEGRCGGIRGIELALLLGTITVELLVLDYALTY